MKISVIIPAYNKSSYLRRCIESVASQDFDSLEIIVVDDGSTDNSGAIIDEFAAKDSRIRAIHTPNGGVTAARKTGLLLSEGKYIMFADADDEMLPNALSVAYEAIERTGADEVIATHCDQYGTHYDFGRRGWGDPDEMITDLLKTNNTFCVLWGVIFRREAILDCFDWDRQLIEREDIMGQMKLLMKQPKVYFIPDCIYLYNKDLPCDRFMGIDKLRLHDRLLKELLSPRWETFATPYYINIAKTYEALIANRRFSVYRKYYKDLLTTNMRALPWKEKIVVMLPPRIAYLPIICYKRWMARH